VVPVVLDFVRDLADGFDLPEPIVEIGARPADGQEHLADVRRILGASEHIGCDIQAGPNVDRIEDVHHLSFADASVGSVVAFETLEHVADPIRAMEEVHRVLRPGGIVAISSLMFMPIHAHPWDYWRFTPEAFELLLRPFESRLVVGVGWDLMPSNVFGVAVKGPFTDLTLSRLPRTKAAHDTWAAGKAVDFGPIRMTVRDLWRETIRYSVRAAAGRARRVAARG
jgi:SAM-dependent methyltransferase